MWTSVSEFSVLILSLWIVGTNFGSSTDEAGKPSVEACSGEWA